MPRLDLNVFWKRGRKPQEVFAERDKALAEWSKSDGYKALLDLYEREFRAGVIAILKEDDSAERNAKILRCRAIYELIALIDRKAATAEAAQSVEEFAARQVADMPADRAELKELDRALMEKALADPRAHRVDSRPAMKPVY